MNVLMLGWELPPHITGGLGVACEGLLQGLHSHGATSVTFVMPDLRGGENDAVAELVAAQGYASMPLGQEDALAMLRGALTGLGNTGPTSLRTSSQGSSLSAYGTYHGTSLAPMLTYAASMPALMKDATFDVIHAHDWLTFPAALIAKRHSKRPLVAHVHSTEVERAAAHANRRIIAIELEGLRIADRIVTVSQATRQVLVQHYRVDPGKVDVVYNAAEHFPRKTPRQRMANADPVVLFIGRMTEQKGPRYFVDAASKVLRLWGDAHFVMAGDGDLLSMMKTLVKVKGLQNRFHFPGFLDACSVRSWLARADVYVMPSLAEPFGIGALEAIRAGVPVVISRQAGVTEVVSHLSCIDAGDAHGMAEAIIRLLDAPGHAHHQALAAQRDEAPLTWYRSAEAVLRVYRALISPPSMHSRSPSCTSSSFG